MRRILFVENSGHIVGGGQLSLLMLMGRLDRRRYAPLCICPEEGDMAEAVRREGIALEIAAQPALRLGSSPAVARALWRLWRLVRRRRIDLLHANGSRCMFYAGVAGRLAGVPVVWHVRVVERDGWWDRLLARLATRIVVISLAVKERFSFVRAREKLGLVHNGVDLEAYGRARGEALRRQWAGGGEALVGMVAQLVPWKRHADFIRAMAAVAAHRASARFVLVGREPEPGGGYERALRALAAELGLGARLVFAGFRRDMPEVMAAFDVVVLSSENEPFGRVLIEAMAASRPVVATRGGGVGEIVRHGETGLLVPPGDVEALAAAVESLLAHPERARRLGAAGRRRAEAHFSIGAHARAIEALYREVLHD